MKGKNKQGEKEDGRNGGSDNELDRALSNEGKQIAEITVSWAQNKVGKEEQKTWDMGRKARKEGKICGKLPGISD